MPVRTPKHTPLSVSPPEIYSHTQLCVLTSMGLWAGKTRWPLNIASTPIFHWFTIWKGQCCLRALKAWSHLIWSQRQQCSNCSPAELGSCLCCAADPCVLGSHGKNTHQKDFLIIQSPDAFSDCFFGVPEKTQYFLPWRGFLFCNVL